MKHTLKAVGTLAAIIAAASIGCVGQNTSKSATEPRLETSAERYAAAKNHIDHNHQSRSYGRGLSIGEIANGEAAGFIHMPMPDSRALKDLKDHLGEWMILQEGHVKPDALLSQNVLPYLDGGPQEIKLYEPFALQDKSHESSELVPRIFIKRNDPYFRPVLDRFAIYHTQEDANRDIQRIEYTLGGKRDIKGSPNITLRPVQITPDLLSRYVK